MSAKLKLVNSQGKGQTFAVIIGVEKYRDAFLKPVLYAEADARAVSAAFVDIGCPVENQRILINEDATATSIESELRSCLAGLSSEDRCFIFFAGHGFSDGHFNYLAAHDSKTRDIEATCVRLQRILGLIKASKSKRVVLFLDACHTGIKVEETMRSAILGIDDAVEDAEFCACYASCRSDEKSYSSPKLKQGIWTHHLLEALKGRVKVALEGTRVDAVKLQRYLREAVPRTIRAEFTVPPRQTPRFFGSFDSVPIIADVASVLAKRKAESAANALNLRRVAFVSSETEEIRSLSGFDKKRGHQPPTRITSATTNFVNGLVHDEIKSHIEAKFQALRSKMKIKLNDIVATIGDGGATIRTPGFDYNVTVAQIEDEPDSVLWRYELINIRDASVFDHPGFNEVFKNSFDTVEFTFSGAMPDIREIAGDLEDAGYEVDCPMDFTYCRFKPEGSDTEVEITPGSVNFVFARSQPPAQLAADFRATHALVAPQPSLRLLLTK